MEILCEAPLQRLGRGLLWDRDTSNPCGLSHLGNVLTALASIQCTAGEFPKFPKYSSLSVEIFKPNTHQFHPP